MTGEGTYPYVLGVLHENETWGNCNAGIWKKLKWVGSQVGKFWIKKIER